MNLFSFRGTTMLDFSNGFPLNYFFRLNGSVNPIAFFLQ